MGSFPKTYNDPNALRGTKIGECVFFNYAFILYMKIILYFVSRFSGHV